MSRRGWTGLVQVTRTGTCAGLVVDAGTIVDAAPILRHLLGRNITDAALELRRRGYVVEPVDQ